MFSLVIRWYNYNTQDDVMNIFTKVLEKYNKSMCSLENLSTRFFNIRKVIFNSYI